MFLIGINKLQNPRPKKWLSYVNRTYCFLTSINKLQNSRSKKWLSYVSKTNLLLPCRWLGIGPTWDRKELDSKEAPSQLDRSDQYIRPEIIWKYYFLEIKVKLKKLNKNELINLLKKVFDPLNTC